MFNLDAAKKDLGESLTFFHQDIAALRTGRATPSLVDNLAVDAYDAKLPLMQLASIAAPEPRLIIIQPWDKGLMKAIEKALQTSNLNLQPIVDKDVIRINFPPLNEENRHQLIKLLHQKAEHCRVSLRQKREKLRMDTMAEQKEGSLTEDEKFKALEQLDQAMKELNDQIKTICDNKEKEILTI